MSWSEDTWEDVTDLPSPDPEEAFLVSDNGFDYHHPVPEKIISNGYSSAKKLEIKKGQYSNSSETLDFRSKEETSKDSAMENLAWALLGTQFEKYNNDQSAPKVRESNGAKNGYHESRLELSEIQTSTSAKASTSLSFKSSSSKEKLNSMSRTNSSSRLTEAGTGPGLISEKVEQEPAENQHKGSKMSQKVPQRVSSSQILGHQQQTTVVETNSTIGESQCSKDGEKGSENSEQYSKLSMGNGKSSRDYTLHEYEKQKMQSRSYYHGRSSIYDNTHNAEHYNIDNITGSEDEDRVNAIICMVFCVMGLGVMIGFICMLVHYTEVKEIKEYQQLGGEDNYPDFLNNLYYHRIAQVINSTSQIDQERLRQDTGSTLDRGQVVRMPLCNIYPPVLFGNLTDINLNITLSVSDIMTNNSDVKAGGEWAPASCTSRHRVAIIIPYRDRWSHLKVLLYYLIPILKRQEIHFRIFIVEQYGNETFNKGRIMNAAFREALKLFDFHCVTFHDVDLVPEDDRNMYSCTEQPKHMSIGIDKFDYVLPYEGLVGGVLMFKAEQFELVNGYSNMYWGWGAEDDDMTSRILHHGLRVYRPPSNIARYKMVKHDGRQSSEVAIRMKLLRSAAKRSKLEGLNNVQYKLLETHIERLFTHFIVDIGHP